MAFWTCGVLMLAAAVLWTVGSAPLRRAAGSASAKAAPESPAARKAGPGAARRMLPALFAAGLVWLVVPAMLHGGLKDGVTSWVPSMIQSNFGASPAFSAAVSMVLPLVNLTGAYLAGWLDHRVFHNEVKTSAALMGLTLACLLALPMAVKASLPASLVLLAATTALMLGVNTMFINVMPVKIGRSSGCDAGQDRPQQRRGRPLGQPERHHLPGGGHRHLGHRRGGRGFRLGGGVRPLGRNGRDGAGRLPAAGPALGPLCPGM